MTVSSSRRWVLAVVLWSSWLGRLQAQAEAPQDFGSYARTLFDEVACPDGSTPAGADKQAAAIAAHCAVMRPAIQRYRAEFMQKAQPFLQSIAPRDVPKTVVYPFGGGDLVSALATYPDATEITTISLERTGDPTQASKLDPDSWSAETQRFRSAALLLLAKYDSATVDLGSIENRPLPGQLMLALTALSITGCTPVGLRYFSFEADGTLHYYTPSEVRELSAVHAKKNAPWRHDSLDSIVFSNGELTFKRPSGELVVYRHVSFNLDDPHFVDSGLSKHLQAKGAVAALTKAASYLLWNDEFSGIRDYLIRRATLMFSDSTGIPPQYASQAGLRQLTYGEFVEPSLPANPKHARSFRELWAAQPRRQLPFRYGYLDRDRHPHLLVTYRATGAL